MKKQTITSTQNPRIRSLRSLRLPKERTVQGRFLVEGIKLVQEAARDARIFTILADEARQEEFSPLFEEASEVLLAPSHIIENVCDTKTPQGICASVAFPPPLDLAEAKGALLVLDGVQDPGNVGTMLRTAEAAGFSGALLSPSCADAFATKTVRATMGSILRLPIWRGALSEALGFLQSRGITLIASLLEGEPLRAIVYRIRLPFALIIGSEGHGVSKEISALSDLSVSLPMRGKSESLNAAVAAGILMYEMMEETLA